MCWSRSRCSLAETAVLERLAELARSRRAICYTAYNHRFEPHFIRMKEAVESGILGRIYLCRMFYGNGTARDVRNSPWRDRGAGVLPDLGSHLLDTALFWFGQIDAAVRGVVGRPLRKPGLRPFRYLVPAAHRYSRWRSRW